MGNKKKDILYSSKYYPLAVLIPSLVECCNSVNFEKSCVLPSKIVLSEGTELEKILDALIASPTIPLVIKEMIENYIPIREKYDNYLNETLMSSFAELEKRRINAIIQ